MEHAIVRELIEAAKGGTTDSAEEVLLKMDALPVPWAWSGCFGVRTNGDVIYVDDGGKPIPLKSLPEGNKEAVATLVYAAKRDARLSCLLPKKPADAKTCPTCNGTGTVTKVDALCGDCIGLGWMHAA